MNDSIETSENEASAPIGKPVADNEVPSRGPRVTPADIEAEIISEHYFTARDGCEGASGGGGIYPVSLGLLTFCVLVLRNGYTVTGESAAASAENFDAAIGQRFAREKATDKIWPLLGFRLRDTIANR